MNPKKYFKTWKQFILYIALLSIFYIIKAPLFTNAQSYIHFDTTTTIVGFYNFENYYDTTDQLNVSDEEFLPNSAKGYNSSLFKNKSMHLSTVIYGMGKIENANGISLLGIAEVENKNVLKNLASQPLIKKYNYQFIHFDSKDSRGIDVALMYHPQYFKPYQYRSYSLTDAHHFTSYATRDILYVQGLLNNNWVHVLVNHWPSRRGGEKASMDKRIWAATVCKRIMDSIESRNPNAKFIVMGDFNDNPNNKSIKHLNMINPFLELFKKGLGSMAYRDSWSLFDQILLSKNWMMKAGIDSKIEDVSSNQNNLLYCKSIIYRNSTLTEQDGRYQGYPKRTWNGDQYMGGYSDHYPALIIFKSKNGEKPLK
jgi:predicted extracellular nuclease